MNNSCSSSDSLPYRVRDLLINVLGKGPVGLHEPIFNGNEKAYVLDCIDSTFVSSVGKYVNEFEKYLCDFTGAKHAVAVSNGTSGLHIALLLADVKPNDEVLIPSLSFVATANAVTYCGAIPHFIDVDEQTLCLSPSLLSEYLSKIVKRIKGESINTKTGRVIKAMVPMHTFGHSAEMQDLLKIAENYKIKLVEDAAESIGSFYMGKHTGTLGLLGVLSFNGNKTITTGGGGAILTNDSDLARKAKHITTTAKIPHRWGFKHDLVGYNYRMPNINAALGCAQLEGLPTILEKKIILFKKYKEAFKSIPEVEIFEAGHNSKSNYWLQTLILNKSVSKYRDEILEVTNSSGYMTRPVWDLLHTLDPYKKFPRSSLKVSKSLEKRIINIPSSTYC